MMEGISVIAEKCSGCGLCLPACPFGAIAVVGATAAIDDSCCLCGACVEACRERSALVMAAAPAAAGRPAGSQWSGIAVLAEHRRGRLMSVVSEIIGAAMHLKAGLRVPVCAILVGGGVRRLAEELLSYGIDEVWLADRPGLSEFAEDSLAELVSRIVAEKKPEIVLGGGTVVGRSLLPRVAARLATGLTADCTELAIEPGTRLLRQTRPAFGGNIMATILCERRRPQMATVRHKVMRPAGKGAAPSGKIVEFDRPPARESAFEVLEFVEEGGGSVNLADAEVIVSGGRGLGDPKNFELVENLARALGGAVGASRAAVDAGWIPYSHQVGQTGKTVKPTVYIACGISGAIQHQVGMKAADLVIAVNKDPAAPIFGLAHYGIVGDLFEVLPELTRRLGQSPGAACP